MSTQYVPQTVLESITEHNRCLDATLKRRFGVSVTTYRTIKAMTQLVAVFAIVFAMTQGMDPTLGGSFIGAMVVGPEIAETVLANEHGTRDDE